MSTTNNTRENEVDPRTPQIEEGSSPVRLKQASWSDLSYYLSMRDGVRLTLYIYFPNHKPPSAPSPTILVQTRYGKAGARHVKSDNSRSLTHWLRAGYTAAIVDVHGTTASFGARDCELGIRQQEDMDEIIEHLTDLPWCNGKIIATGTSYTANTADLATSRPKAALVAAIPRATDFDWWEAFWPGGIANDSLLKGWAELVSEMDFGRLKVKSNSALEGEEKILDGRKRIGDIADLFPLIQPVDEDTDHKLVLEALQTREVHHCHWKADDYSDISFGDDRTVSGHSFFDASAAAHMDNIRDESINRFRSAPNVPSIIIITGNDHGGGVRTDPFFPDERDPLPSVEEQWRMQVEFADAVMNDQVPSRVIKYYVLGVGVFRETTVWPPLGLENTNFNLNHRGRLTRDVAFEGKDSYNVDFTATTGKHNRWYQFTRANYGVRRIPDQKLLTYNSPPFNEAMELVGWPVLTLQMSTTTNDPSIFAYLEDVSPDGTVTYITEGQLRAINRKIANVEALPYDPGPAPHSFLRGDAMPVVPGEKFSLTFKMYAIAALIRQGHRVRLAIGGADCDTFRRLGEGPERFEVFRGENEGSTLDLPLRKWSCEGSGC
ncbi:CocE/NonD hydrolase [Tothia fuscella]|uniref:CocE/NonD hydrolase n=1 Tax=Tothia fuscella TaxID=1048955 RepID=A0A9P4NH02_9PEZI|nr:CocE/NonD hydrolase [Tothia fuscella]